MAKVHAALSYYHGTDGVDASIRRDQRFEANCAAASPESGCPLDGSDGDALRFFFDECAEDVARGSAVAGESG
jgi:hypothetical protein